MSRRPRLAFLPATLLLSMLLFPGSMLALDPGKSVFQYNCKTWTRQTGLPANSISAILQSKAGYLWLGTIAGPVRFDGMNFDLIELGKLAQFRATETTSLAASKSGCVWAGVNNGGVAIINGKQVTRLEGRASEGMIASISSLVEGDDGDLFVTSQGQAGRVKQGKMYETILPAPGTNTYYDVRTVHRDSQGRIWFGTTKAGLYVWQAGVLSKFPDATLDDILISAVAVDQQGVICVGTAIGLLRYDTQFHRLPSTLTTEIHTLLVDRHGVLWAGTSGGGLFRCQGEAVTQFRKVDGLADDFVTALAEDREGNLWVGTRNGLSELSDVLMPTFGKTEGLADVNISVSAARRGGIWVASSSGVVHLEGGTNVQAYAAVAGLTNTYIMAVVEARNGDLYVTTGDMEILVCSGGKIVARYPNKDYPTGLVEDAQGVIAAVSGKLYRVSAGAMTPYLLADGSQAAPGYLFNMLAGRDGALWLAVADSGIMRIKEGVMTNWPLGSVTDNTPGSFFIYEDEEGTVWASSTTGIARLKNGLLRLITKADGLFDNVIFALVLDDHGRFWADGTRGFFSVTRQALNDFADGKTTGVECVVYDSLRAVKGVERNQQKLSGCKSLDGLIWFPTAQGVVMIDPTNLAANPVPPLVHIGSVLANGRELGWTNGVVAPGKGELEFRFVGISFVAPESIHYRYKLEGYDRDWVEAGNRRMAFYTNLKPGAYKFHVIAANADGTWNETGATFDLELLPHFYQTVWFYLGCAGLVLAALGGVYAWRVRLLKGKQVALQKARDLLEAEVRNRTIDLAQANAELGREQALLRALLDNSPDQIYFKDAQSRYLKTSRAQANNFGVASPDELIGKTDFDYFGEEHARPAFEDEQEIIRTGRPLIGKIEKEVRKDGQKHWVLSSKMPLRNKANEIVGTFGISKDITVIKEAEAKLEQVHKQLLQTSRQAGMAEVATSVLHNVGNVLNSVNVASVCIAEGLRKSKVANLPKVVALLREHEADLGNYLTQDAKGKQVPGYLAQLADHMVKEQAVALQELVELQQHIDHIKEIVAMQQSFAKVSGVTEMLTVTELVEDALRLNESSLLNHGVQIVREFADAPLITVEKHKALQILVNLMQNAKQACNATDRPDKRVTLRVRSGGQHVRISVSDNGEGIPAENLARIFNHGFTTKKGGHGFGLHSGALAAKELGGSLFVHSDGPGQGATFTLELPLGRPTPSLN